MDDFILHPLLENSTICLAQLPLCSLLLSNDKQYPWFILVPRVNGITEVYELDANAQKQFLYESSLLSSLLMKEFNGDKLNVAAIGNICPQLHVHHIIRYKVDVAWPAPVWGKFAPLAYNDSEIVAIQNKLKPLIMQMTVSID